MSDSATMTVAKPAGPTWIGYARVSTEDQSLDAQLDELTRAGCIDTCSEHGSGKRDDRPELANALRALRHGDTLVVTRFDRLGRSLSHLIETVEGLRSRGVNFESLAERIDTSSAAGELILHMFASMAQFERRLISERTKAALAAGRARGRQGGRRASLTITQLRQAKRLLDDPDVSSADVARTFGVSRSTLYANLKRLEAGKGGDHVRVERR